MKTKDNKRYGSKLIDYTDKEFNCWRVIQRTERPSNTKKREQGEAYWLCESKCGKLRVVRSDHMKDLQIKYPNCSTNCSL